MPIRMPPKLNAEQKSEQEKLYKEIIEGNRYSVISIEYSTGFLFGWFAKFECARGHEGELHWEQENELKEKIEKYICIKCEIRAAKAGRKLYTIFANHAEKFAAEMSEEEATNMVNIKEALRKLNTNDEFDS